MWENRKLLFAAVVFTALHCKVAKSQIPLDWSPDAVDDMYTGCREKALDKFILSGVLKQELAQSESFQKAWTDQTNCSKLMPGKREEHTAALNAYANAGIKFRETFNKAVETLGANVSTYENDFHFKSLHFLLMDSMTLLPKEKCKTVYVLSEDKHTATKGSKVRLGRFTMVYPNYEAVKDVDWDENSLFNITTCLFANLGANICSEEKTVLLSPMEAFTVEDVNSKIDEDEARYTEIILRHLSVEPTHNCYIFSRSPAGVSTQWLVLVLMALSLFIFNC